MDRNVKIVCVIVGLLGLLAAALGFAAEAKRIKGTQIHYAPPSECVYPRSPVLALGLTASVALMVAQTIINVLTGCLCCIRGPYQCNPSWTVALVCYILSWFTFVVSVLLLILSAALNDRNTEELIYLGDYYCYALKPGVFAVAASLSLATVVFGIMSYITVESARKRGEHWALAASIEQPSIGMGQVQAPQQR